MDKASVRMIPQADVQHVADTERGDHVSGPGHAELGDLSAHRLAIGRQQPRK
jgi:hypothetical protein